jgi:tetraprenyl-beta-curcumene synthase
MAASSAAGKRLAWPAVFARAARNYWIEVFPLVARELDRWHGEALEIPDPLTRAQALEALAKRGNMEGAAAFATFAPPARRPAVVRAAVAFQTAYNHLDTLSERANIEGPEQSRRLHEPLLAAMAGPQVHDGGGQAGCPDAWPSRHPGRDDERPSHPQKNEDAYVAALVDTCRASLCELPSYAIVAPAARRAAERVVSFQAYNRCERADIERWGRAQTPPGSDLQWWETAASGGSSLGVHVTIAAAAEPGIGQTEVDALEQAYFPWIGALHSMLDQLIDVEEDARTGQPNLVELYGSAGEAAQRMALLARRALECARDLPPAHRHELIVAAMAAFYLSAPEASVGEAAVVRRAVLEVFGGLARPALAVFRARRLVERAALMPRRADAGSADASGRPPLRGRLPLRASRSAG